MTWQIVKCKLMDDRYNMTDSLGNANSQKRGRYHTSIFDVIRE